MFACYNHVMAALRLNPKIATVNGSIFNADNVGVRIGCFTHEGEDVAVLLMAHTERQSFLVLDVQQDGSVILTDTSLGAAWAGIDPLPAGIKSAVKFQPIGEEYRLIEVSRARAQCVFYEAYRKARPIAFNPKWANTTGYFDYAVEGPDAPEVEIGKPARARDQHGRHILLIGTPVGNVVVFQREAAADSHMVLNAPRAVEQLFDGQVYCGPQTEDSLKYVIGRYSWSDVGARMRDFIATIMKSKKD